MKDCPASEFGCTRNRCAVDRDDDLEALKQFNRATSATAMCLILIAVVLGIFAVGLWRTEQVHKAIVAERNV